LADGRQLANRARDEAMNYRETYRAPPPLKVLPAFAKETLSDHSQAVADRVGLYVQAYTLYSSVRPFGINAVFGAVDKDGPQLFVVEPSGVYFVSYRFTASLFKQTENP
jgi:20S proteasome subunit alpha 7